MKKSILLILLIFSIFFSTACTKKTAAPTPKTGVELVAIGTINFGGLILNSYRDAAIKIYNFGPSALDTSNIRTLLAAPFIVQSVGSPCNSGSLPANANCVIAIRFNPTAIGSFSQDFKIGGQSLTTSGSGLINGSLSLLDDSWQIGSLVAGAETRKSFTFSNDGDFTVDSPVPTLNAGITTGFNNCGSFLIAHKQCQIELISTKTIAGIYNEDIVFKSGTLALPVHYQGTVLSDVPFGIITFQTNPTSIVADGGSILNVTTNPIKDKYNNIVNDGTNVNFSVSNFNLITPNSLTTVGGIVSFSVRATSQRGYSTVTLLADEAVGVLRVLSTAGAPYGAILLEGFQSSIIANGSSQIIVKNMPIFDQNGNLVEDGTPIYFFLNGSGILSNPFAYTSLGSATVVITSPIVSGTALLQVRGGPIYDSNNNIIDWKARGDFQITYTPDVPSGTIPISSIYQGIYAQQDYDAELAGEIVRTQITIGPIKDRSNNIVKPNTPITVGVTNGTLLGAGSNPATLYTDSNGNITTLIAGNGTRGTITIYATHPQGAAGSLSIWGYLPTRLIYDNTPTNPLKLYEKYFTSLTLPDALINWGEAVGYSGISFPDTKNQYGTSITNYLQYNSSTKMLLKSTIPYMDNNCWTTGNGYLILAPCQKNSDRTDEGPYAYNLFSTTNPQKITNLSADRNFSAAHNTHDPTCYDYNIYTPTYTASSNKSNCQDEVNGGGINCWWDNNTFDGQMQVFGKCVPKPLINNAISYNESLDQLLLFGGSIFKQAQVDGGAIDNILYNADRYSTIYPNLLKFGVQSSSSNQTGGEDFVDIGNYPSDGESLAEFVQKDNLHIGFGGYQQNFDCASIKTSSGCSAIPDNICEWNSGLSACKNVSIGNLSTNSEPLKIFNGASKKWLSVSPSEDPNEPAGLGYPSGRYQHALYYDSNSQDLFVVGGLRKFQCEEYLTPSMCSMATISSQCVWSSNYNKCSPRSGKAGAGYIQGPSIGQSDVWKVNLSNLALDGSGSLQWQRMCGSQMTTLADNVTLNPANISCNIPAAFNNLDNQQSLSAIKTSAFFNPLRQKTYVYFSKYPKAYELNKSNGVLSEVVDGASQLAGMQQVVFDKKTGRTIGYDRLPIDTVQSNLYVWDMNPNEKRYYKAEFQLGSGAKSNAFSLSPDIRGYGASGTANGIKAYIYNFDNSSWELIGSNTSNAYSQMDGTEITKSYTRTTTGVSKYISMSGVVDILIVSNGDPNDGDSTLINIDQIYLDGKF